MSDSVTELYVEECARNEDLRRSAQRAAFPTVFAEFGGSPLLSRPMFAPRGRLLGFAEDLAAIFRLMVSLPHRLFGGDLHRYCAAAGISGDEAALMMRGATGDPPLFGRADAYDDGTGYRLLEFNIGSDLGGLELAEHSRALLGVDAFRDFAQRHGLTFVDTAQVVADLLRTLARPLATTNRPVVAVLEATGGLARGPQYRVLQDTMLRCGLDFRLAEVQQVEYRRGRLELARTPIDVAMRYHSACEILEGPYGPAVLDPVYQAREAGGTILFTGLEQSLYNAKGTLALLSDERYRDAFDDGERRLIDRIVPWTRMLEDDPALIERCRDEQPTLIVKPSVGWSGKGAVFGSEVTAEQWYDMITARLGKRHVVQRVVLPVPEPVPDPDTGTVEDWHATWGVFVTEAGYAGTYVRALRPADGRIISGATAGTCDAGVFMY